MKLNQGDIVYIEFDDHATSAPTWEPIEDAHHHLCSVSAVGIVVRDTDYALTISQLMTSKVHSQSFTLVKACITKLEILNISDRNDPEL